MKFFEYSAKEIFKKEGIPVPTSSVAENAEEVEEATRKINKSVAIKSQVLVGGRGKAGGIKFADTPEEAKTASSGLLGTEIKGEIVNRVLIEEKIDIQSEFYISVVMDRAAKKPLIMASTEGGVEIEEVAKNTPEKIVKYHINPLDEFMPYQAREIARKMGVENHMISSMAGFIWKLYNVFKKYDATIAEINPLVLTPEGLIAADAKLEIDDDSLWRHKEFAKLDEAKKEEFAYVTLEGNIAVIGNGAGLTLTGMDMINLYGGKPATFLDIGGGSSKEIVGRALNLVIAEPNVKVIFLNVLGGITRADDVAKGVIDVMENVEREVPIVIRLTGTNEEEGQRILTEAGISFETSMEAAAKKAVELCESLN
ncbi:ADP-forming succinate--CoA ligase subunit beta [Methanobacterium sp. ACI-7]|uniref:ADP-forming succinate--CoA ligase subunit beta n=1 Tax=unclassified Methanobacterium TaxID=2627676 RepID=UPI0039C2177E